MVDIKGIVSNGIQQANAAPLSIISPENLTPADLLKAARVYPEEMPEADPVVIAINAASGPVNFGTLGNFSLLTGKAKAKKSFLVSMLLAAATRNNSLQDTIICSLPTDKRRVILIDTEQGRYRVWKALQRVCKLLEIETPETIEAYDLRPHDPASRVEMVHQCLIDGNPKKDIGLVVIDGIRDLINDINDPKDATTIATKLMQWSANAGCHIVTVLHQNKGDNNARGHVGTELVNKAETVISVAKYDKDPAISIVEPEECRDREIPGFAFAVNDAGLPEILPDFELKGNSSTQGKKSFNPYNFPPETHHAILAKAFKGESIGYAELQSRLKVEWAANNQEISNNATQDLITYCYHKMEWIEHNGKKGPIAKYNYKPH